MATKMIDVRLRKTVFVVTIVAALFLGMLAPFMAVVPEAKAAPIGGMYGGGFKIALQSEPGALNPLASTDSETLKIIDLVYDSLARRDPATLALEPWVASSWTVDGVNVTVALKENVLWHDGEEVTLDDVVYTYNIAGYAPDCIVNVTKDASAKTVTFTLDQPNGTFLVDGLLLKLVPDGFTNTSAPMGCGPYMYGSSVGNVSLTINAFDDHFVGRPYLDSITYTYYTDFETAAKALLNNTVNFLGWNLDVTQASQNINFSGQNTNLLTYNNTTVARSFGTEFLYLGFNCKDTSLLHELPLRKAIAYCIDKASISNLDVSGSAKSTNSIMSSRNTPWYNASISKLDFDLTEANAILDLAGYFDLNGDGWRDKAGSVWNKTTKTFTKGGSFSLRLLLPTIDESLTLGTIGDQILETSIEAIGLNLTLDNKPMAGMDAIIASDDFDIYLGVEKRGEISPMFLKTMFYSTNIATGTNYMNFNGTTTQINGTIEVDSETNIGTISRTNLDPNVAVSVYKNGVVWGKAVNQTIMVYNGTQSIASLGNTSILTYKIYKNDAEMTDGTHYTLNPTTGNVTILTAAAMVVGDVINATYTYKTYENLNYKTGKLSVVANFNSTTDKLTMTFDYRGVDDAMDKMSLTLDQGMLANHSKEAQGFLSEQVPYAPILSYMVLNAYSKERYVGWVSMLGGLYNYWSMTSLKNNLYDGGTLKSLVVSASAYPGYVESAGTLPIDITVTDSESNPIPGATIIISVDSGTLSTMTDNGDGTYSATYTAPTITSTISASISTMAAISGYVAGYTNTTITVHTVSNLFTIEVTPAVSSMKSGNETIVSVLVTDEATGLAVSGADVVVTVEPAGAGGWIVDGIGTTDTSGAFEVTLRTANVTVDTTFRIVASVTKISYQPDSGTANVAVTRYGGVKPDNGFLGLPGIGAFASLAAIGTAAILFGAFRKRRKL
ncbi:MAG: ABC transporter substrate-binding protein [Methanobacteriota archaeon]